MREDILIPYENEKSPGKHAESSKLQEELKKAVFGSTIRVDTPLLQPYSPTGLGVFGGPTSRRLRKGMFAFIGESLSRKGSWLRARKDEDIIVVHRREVEDWILKLRGLWQSIEGLVSSLRTELKCEPNTNQI